MMFIKTNKAKPALTLLGSACFGIAMLGISNNSLAADVEIKVGEEEVHLGSPPENSGTGQGVQGDADGNGVGVIQEENDSIRDGCFIPSQCERRGSILDDAKQLSPKEEADAIENGWAN